MLKIAGANGNAYQREDRNARRNQPDPATVQQLIDMMGGMMTRERVVLALQQSRNDINAATNLLFEWLA